MNPGRAMRLLKWLAALWATVVIGALAAGQAGWLRGTPPGDLGVRDGRLKPPSTTPNSVSSQAALYADHPQRAYAAIAPLALRGDGAATIARIEAIVARMPGAVIVTRRPDYLYAQFTTPLMKFVDDAEFWYDPSAQVVQVRSASRIGRGDRGLNRERIESVRASLASAP